jgi:hypothetical protein
MSVSHDSITSDTPLLRGLYASGATIPNDSDIVLHLTGNAQFSDVSPSLFAAWVLSSPENRAKVEAIRNNFIRSMAREMVIGDRRRLSR